MGVATIWQGLASALHRYFRVKREARAALHQATERLTMERRAQKQSMQRLDAAFSEFEALLRADPNKAPPA